MSGNVLDTFFGMAVGTDETVNIMRSRVLYAGF